MTNTFCVTSNNLFMSPLILHTLYAVYIFKQFLSVLAINDIYEFIYCEKLTGFLTDKIFLHGC
jgi:hypothetical protein